MTRPGGEPRRPRTDGAGSAPHGRSGRPSRQIGPSSLWEDHPSGPQPLRASWDPVQHETRQPVRPKVRPERRQRRRSRLGWFVHRYGWRAYAIPVLSALTVLVIIQITTQQTPSEASTVTPAPSPVVTVISGVKTTITVTAPPTSPSSAQPQQSAPSTGSTAPDPNGTFAAGLASGALPGGADFTATGRGTWHVVPGKSAPIGTGSNRKTYRVEVEDGIQSAEADREFASAVDRTLADPRSWIGSGDYTLQRIESGTPDFTIALTSQMTERKPELCGWEIKLEASCYARDVSRVSINNARWARGAVSFNGDLGSYRVYAINHEVGHALGFRHQPCGENGGLAPVMMQQSWSTSNDDLARLDPQTIPADGKVCRFNPYPYPRGGVPTTGATASGG